MIPTVMISTGSGPVSGLTGRILSGSIVETDGESTDQLTLEISNYDGMLAKPAQGAMLTVELGWDTTGVFKAGVFKVQEVTKHGETATFTVTAHAAALDDSLKIQKSRCWKPPQTYGQVFQQIASDNGLSAAVHPSIAAIAIDTVLAQHGESDMHFAMRVARGVGAIAKMAQGNLVIVPKGAGQSASGASIPPLTVTPADLLDGWTIGAKQRPKRGQCKANVFNRETATRSQVKAGDASNGPDYVFPQVFGSPTEANHAVSARSAAFKRAEKHFSGALRPGLAAPPAGGVLTTDGFGDDDDTNWTIKRLTTAFSQKGIVIGFEGEIQATNPPSSPSSSSTPSSSSSGGASGGVQEAGAVTAGSNVG